MHNKKSKLFFFRRNKQGEVRPIKKQAKLVCGKGQFFCVLLTPDCKCVMLPGTSGVRGGCVYPAHSLLRL